MMQLFIYLAALFTVVHSKGVGVLLLDEITFDKVINQFDAVFVEFSNDHSNNEVLEKLSSSLSGNLKATVAQVLLEEEPKSNPYSQYDEYDYPDYPEESEEINTQLAERFGITRDNWPSYRLFLKGKKQPISFSLPEFDPEKEDSTTELVETATRFLKQNGVYVGLVGCLKEMDELTSKFMLKKDERSNIVKESKIQGEKYEDAQDKTSAKIYVTYMEKVVEKGDGFIQTEAERLKRLLSGEMSTAKRSEVTKRANVLSSFSHPQQKDEL